MKVAILGYGNIGRATEQAVLAAPDMQLVGVYHHDDCLDQIQADVVILCLPSREIPTYAPLFLSRGICTVDSFDIHTAIPALRKNLMALAKANNVVSITAAGWDPGTDSVVRCLMQAMAPQGLTYTNFGPGRSMGHTVAAKAISGVKDALSMTIPLGTGVHRRMVYVELQQGASLDQVTNDILKDDYFAHDETHVIPVPSVEELNSLAHGVEMLRSGVSGSTHNQRMAFTMSINNPALTGQILTGAARATQRLSAGCYTLIEVPPVALLSGDADTNVAKLV